MSIRRVVVPDLKEKKRGGERITVLTAFDATMARLMDAAGVDVLLVGDSLGMVALGFDSTVPVTLDDMVRHTQAVARGASRALVVADMPFLSYHTGGADALRNAGRLIQEGGAAVVKLEGGAAVSKTVRRLVRAGIPVMGHLGLLPQSINQLGSYRRQATEPDAAETLLNDARLLEDAGACAVVLEMIPPELAARVTAALSIPTIGIGAGPECDGQVLVGHDVLGLTTGAVPSFVKRYGELGAAASDAVRAYVEDVRAGTFPGRATAAGAPQSVR
jgi:3-methyl-2-oxobutanoate hydroxymethyltransferase